MKQHEEKSHPLNEFYSKIYRRYDLINRLFTLGFDKKWRRVTARKCLSEQPERVLDLCCGTADLAIEIRKYAGKDSPFIQGYDFNENMLSLARIKSEEKQLKNIEFKQGDAAQMPFGSGTFDAVTIGFGFRNLTYQNPNADKHISEISRVLSNKGSLYILESGVPQNKLIRFFYILHLRMILIPLGSLLSGNRSAYTYLADSSANFFRREEIVRMLSEKGFAGFEHKSFFFGATNLLIAHKKKR